MKEMLRMILDMDKQACERVKEAEAYRDKEIAELGEKKNRITEEENQKALDFALKKSQKQLYSWQVLPWPCQQLY